MKVGSRLLVSYRWQVWIKTKLFVSNLQLFGFSFLKLIFICLKGVHYSCLMNLFLIDLNFPTICLSVS